MFYYQVTKDVYVWNRQLCKGELLTQKEILKFSKGSMVVNPTQFQIRENAEYRFLRLVELKRSEIVWFF